MFFYLSFLRPPPIQAAPAGTILITPQISNDLRTEPYKTSQDIFYSWAPYPPVGLATSAATFSLKTTKPTKLTSYSSVSAYKEIPVPVPPGVREGQQWQLILSPSAGTASLQPNYVIDMHDPAIGNAVLPVISMPISFSAKGLRRNVKKQEKIERMYRIPSSIVADEITSGATSTRELKITEQTSFDLDKKIWDSGIGLSSWLVELRQLDGGLRNNRFLDTVWHALFSNQSRRMVELGAGTGIVSLTIASLRAQSSTSDHAGDEIIATDLESAITLLNHNIHSNLPLYPYDVPKATVLNWEDEELPLSIRSLGKLDVILMSDVTYNTSSFPALLKTIVKLVEMREPPVILFGYKERDEAERDVWRMLEERGIRLEKIGERLGAANPSVEIWFGRIAGCSA